MQISDNMRQRSPFITGDQVDNAGGGGSEAHNTQIKIDENSGDTGTGQ